MINLLIFFSFFGKLSSISLTTLRADSSRPAESISHLNRTFLKKCSRLKELKYQHIMAQSKQTDGKRSP